MTITTEILFFVALGLWVLGPKCMYAMLERVARAKTEFDNATRTFKSQFAAEFDLASGNHEDVGC